MESWEERSVKDIFPRNGKKSSRRTIKKKEKGKKGKAKKKTMEKKKIET